MATFGFIGCGNMGGALAQALSTVIPPSDIYLNNRTMAKAETLAQSIGAQTASAHDIAATADYIMLGVKPHLMAGVLHDIAPTLATRKTPFTLVSMAAGLTLDTLDTMCDDAHYPILRIMPNTPCSIGKGIILYTPNEAVAPQSLDAFLHAFSGAGLLSAIAENLMDVGAVVAGSAPAFADLFLESLADGAVAFGLPRAQAMELSCAMMIGAASLAQQSGTHPGALKDAVCSPAGSTIQGIRALEAGGFRSSIIEAAIATYDKMKDLG